MIESLGYVQQSENVRRINSSMTDNLAQFLSGSTENMWLMEQRAGFLRIVPGGPLIARRGVSVMQPPHMLNDNNCFFIDAQFKDREKGGGTPKRAIAKAVFEVICLKEGEVGIEIKMIQTQPFTQKNSIVHYMPIKHKEFFLHLIEQLSLLLAEKGLPLAFISMAPECGWDSLAAVKQVKKQLHTSEVGFVGYNDSPEVDDLVAQTEENIVAARTRFLAKHGYLGSGSYVIKTLTVHHEVSLLLKPIAGVVRDEKMQEMLDSLTWTQAFLQHAMEG